MQEATLKELSAHPTVEYIRRLEEENARIQRALSRERRSVSDMRVALNAARRAQRSPRWSSRARRAAAGARRWGARTRFIPRRQSSGARSRSSLVGESAVAFGAHAETKPGDPTAPEFRATEGSARVVTHQGLTAVGTARPASASLGYPGVPGGFFFGARVERVFFDDPAIRRLPRRLGRCSGTSASRKRAPSRTTPTRTRRRRTQPPRVA